MLHKLCYDYEILYNCYPSKDKQKIAAYSNLELIFSTFVAHLAQCTENVNDDANDMTEKATCLSIETLYLV